MANCTALMLAKLPPAPKSLEQLLLQPAVCSRAGQTPMQAGLLAWSTGCCPWALHSLVRAFLLLFPPLCCCAVRRPARIAAVCWLSWGHRADSESYLKKQQQNCIPALCKLHEKAKTGVGMQRALEGCSQPAAAQERLQLLNFPKTKGKGQVWKRRYVKLQWSKAGAEMQQLQPSSGSVRAGRCAPVPHRSTDLHAGSIGCCARSAETKRSILTQCRERRKRREVRRAGG